MPKIKRRQKRGGGSGRCEHLSPRSSLWRFLWCTDCADRAGSDPRVSAAVSCVLRHQSVHEIFATEWKRAEGRATAQTVHSVAGRETDPWGPWVQQERKHPSRTSLCSVLDVQTTSIRNQSQAAMVSSIATVFSLTLTWVSSAGLGMAFFTPSTIFEIGRFNDIH